MNTAHKALLLLGGAGGVHFTDDFSSLKAGWSANLSVSGGQAIVTPTQTLVLDEHFDDWTGDDPDGVTVTGETGDTEVTQRNPGEFNADAPGTGAANVYMVSPNISLVLTWPDILTLNEWHVHELTDAVSSGRLQISYSAVGAGAHVTHLTPNYVACGLANTTDFRMTQSSNPLDWTIDRVQVWRISDFVAYRDLFVEGTVAVNGELRQRTTLGVAHYVDADNYVMALMINNGFGGITGPSYAGRIFLIKVVGGTVSVLGDGGNAQSAVSHTLSLTRSGNDYSVQYDESTVITTTAVNDAVFATETKWGIFSVHGDNRFNSFEAVSA